METKLKASEWLDFLHRGGKVAHFWCANPQPTSTWFENTIEDRRRAYGEAIAVHPEQYVSINPSRQIPPHNKSGNTDPRYISKQIEYIQCINVLHCEYDGKDWVKEEDAAYFLLADYTTLAPKEKEQAFKEATSQAFYFDPDLYKAEALAHIYSLPYAPTLIVDSGGGYHCYWYLRETVNIDDTNRQSVIDTQHWWVLMNGGDVGVSDITRVYRVIGSKNMKPGWKGNYPTVTAIEYDPHRRYDYAMLAEIAADWYSATTATEQYRYEPAPIYQNGNGAAAAGQVRELFNARHGVADLLQAHGYKLRYKTGTLARMVRPGGDKPSVTVLPADGVRPEIAVAHNTADPLFRDGKGHDAYSIAQTITHRGDWKAAYVEAKKDVGLWDEEPKPAKAKTKAAPKPEEKPVMPKTYNHTDWGNAQRLVAKFGADMIYIHKWDKWYLWNGERWVEDSDEEVIRMAKVMVASLYKEAAELDDDSRAKLVRWALASESSKRLSDMVKLARSEPGIPCSESALDQNHMLLNCANGTIDLTTGELLPHDREHRITKQIPVAYNPAAQCPTWLSFLNDIMMGNADLIAYLQRAVGYTLTGDTSGQCLFFMYGGGSNGKSTFIAAIAELLKAYAQKAPTEMIMQKYGAPGIPNDVARLVGSRLVVVSELEENRRLAEMTVKDLTGGVDTISARFMRGEWFDFMPTHKLWMYGNHKPVITGTDDGIWRRIHLIPFLRKFEEHEKDTHMIDKLRAEFEGILAWAVQGCLLWQREGLQPPTQVVEATKTYRGEMDSLQQFIDERCYISSTVQVRFSELLKAYESWCEMYKVTAVGGRKFGNSLTDRGFVSVNGAGNVAFRKGIALLHES